MRIFKNPTFSRQDSYKQPKKNLELHAHMCVHMYTRMAKHFAIFVISVAYTHMCMLHYYQPPKNDLGMFWGPLRVTVFGGLNRPCTHTCTHTYVHFYAGIMKIHVVNGCSTWRENPCVFPSGNNENTHSNGCLGEGSHRTDFETEITRIVHTST